MDFIERLEKIKMDILSKRYPSGWKQIERIRQKAEEQLKGGPLIYIRAKMFEAMLHAIDISI